MRFVLLAMLLLLLILLLLLLWIFCGVLLICSSLAFFCVNCVRIVCFMRPGDCRLALAADNRYLFAISGAPAGVCEMCAFRLAWYVDDVFCLLALHASYACSSWAGAFHPG